MTPLEMKKFRQRYKITLLELAAMCGLPSEHIRKIEESEYPGLDSDIARIDKALLTISQHRKDIDSDDKSVFSHWH